MVTIIHPNRHYYTLDRAHLACYARYNRSYWGLGRALAHLGPWYGHLMGPESAYRWTPQRAPEPAVGRVRDYKQGWL